MSTPFFLLTIIGVLVLAAVATAIKKYYGGPPVTPDYTGMVGQHGRAESTFAVDGKVLVRGEIWEAESNSGIIERGERIRVVGYRDTMVLLVEREGEVKNASAPAAPAREIEENA